jgi:hypothetical protein
VKYHRHNIQIGFKAYITSSKIIFPGVKRLELEVDHSLPSSAEIKNARRSAFTLIRGIVLGDRDNFLLVFVLKIIINLDFELTFLQHVVFGYSNDIFFDKIKGIQLVKTKQVSPVVPHVT